MKTHGCLSGNAPDSRKDVMSEKKENASRFLRNCIFEALILLMKQKPYDDIAISEITNRAGVSRMTYYRTYTSKEDILIQYFQDSRPEYLPAGLNGAEEPLRVWVHAVLQASAAMRQTLLLISQNCNLHDRVHRYFLDETEKVLNQLYHIAEQGDGLTMNYVAGGVAQAISFWIHHECQPPLAETEEILLNLLYTVLQKPHAYKKTDDAA